MSGIEYGFREWFDCPTRDAREEVSAFDHGTEIVFECHGSGQISEYVIGENVPLRGLNLGAIEEAADEVTND